MFDVLKAGLSLPSLKVKGFIADLTGLKFPIIFRDGFIIELFVKDLSNVLSCKLNFIPFT